MPNVFADTHDPPLRPPVSPARGFGINHGRQLLSDLRTATGVRLDALAWIAGLRRFDETEAELRARLIDVYAEHLQTLLDADQALVARARASIGARPAESTDAALAALEGVVRGVRAALGAREGDDLVSAAAKARVDSDRLSKIRAALGL